MDMDEAKRIKRQLEHTKIMIKKTRKEAQDAFSVYEGWVQNFCRLKDELGELLAEKTEK